MESSLGLYNALDDITVCGLCRMRYNNTDMQPKFLKCKHFFCLKCIQSDMMRGHVACCISCWTRTSLDEERGPEGLETNMSLVILVQNLSQLNISGNGLFPALSLSKLTSSSTTSTSSIASSDLESSSKSENCATHAMPHVSFCPICYHSMCRVCAQEHSLNTGHQLNQLKPTNRDQSNRDLINGQVETEVTQLGKLIGDIHRLEKQQQLFLLKVLEACTTLKRDVELELQTGRYLSVVPEVGEVHDLLVAAKKHLQQETSSGKGLHIALLFHKQRLQTQYLELLLQCQLDEMIVSSDTVFDFPAIKLMLQALSQNKQHTQNPTTSSSSSNSSTSNDPILFLANYCMSRLYPQHILSDQSQLKQNGSTDVQQTSVPPLSPPKSHFLQSQDKVIAPPTSVIIISRSTGSNPLFFFSIEIGGVAVGRVVIETRHDVAPKMVDNFQSLCLGDRGYGYKGCSIFQCWKGESLITGDFEYNNGRGGYSIYDGGFFMPDDTKLPAIRGSVGMRRTQKRHDSKGSVGSQFRVILKDMPGFTAIFGHVVEGLDLLDKVSQYGDLQGTPMKSIIVVSCGKM